MSAADGPKTAVEQLRESEQRRAERKKVFSEAKAAQRLIDLDHVDRLEVEHGDESVKVVNVQWAEGIPTLAVVRCPTKPEMKRYQDRIRAKDANPISAAEEVAACCVVYPEGESLTALYEKRPGLPAQLGAEAVTLAVGEAEKEGKD